MRGYANVKAFNLNVGDYVFYKSLGLRSAYLKKLYIKKNNELNDFRRKIAAEHCLEGQFLQYNTLLFNYWNITEKEKQKLCADKKFKNIFENVQCNVAFTNDNNIKKMVVRTNL